MKVVWPLSKKVEVEWRDSASRGGWQSVEEERGRCAVGPIRSLGYLLTSNKKVVQITQSMSGMTGDVADTITIPRENVIRIKHVR